MTDNRTIGPRPHGIKNYSETFRTIGGQRYNARVTDPSDELIKAYRQYGIHCRRLANILYVHNWEKFPGCEMMRTVMAPVDEVSSRMLKFLPRLRPRISMFMDFWKIMKK